MQGKLFVISACSGAGKTTLIETLLSQLKGVYDLERVITYTSKEPRSTEIDGKDYNFLSCGEFEKRINEGFFLEWSSEYGHYYGSPSKLIKEMSTGKSFLLIVDLMGAQSIASKVKDAVFIWIEVQDIETIKKRLLQRNTENFEQIKKRLELAQQEFDHLSTLSIFKHKVVNEHIENAVWQLKLIIESELKKTKKNEHVF